MCIRDSLQTQNSSVLSNVLYFSCTLHAQRFVGQNGISSTLKIICDIKYSPNTALWCFLHLGYPLKKRRKWREKGAALSVVQFVGNIPQLKLWGSPKVGLGGSVCNYFPTPVCILSYIYECSVTCHSGCHTQTSEISMKESVISWRLLQLKVTLTWDSQHNIYFASAQTFWLEPIKCQ